MARRPKTRREISQWHRQFKQVKQDWAIWLGDNATRFQTAEDAWSAFKAQQQRNSSRQITNFRINIRT